MPSNFRWLPLDITSTDLNQEFKMKWFENGRSIFYSKSKCNWYTILIPISIPYRRNEESSTHRPFNTIQVVSNLNCNQMGLGLGMRHGSWHLDWSNIGIKLPKFKQRLNRQLHCCSPQRLCCLFVCAQTKTDAFSQRDSRHQPTADTLVIVFCTNRCVALFSVTRAVSTRTTKRETPKLVHTRRHTLTHAHTHEMPLQLESKPSKRVDVESVSVVETTRFNCTR